MARKTSVRTMVRRMALSLALALARAVFNTLNGLVVGAVLGWVSVSFTLVGGIGFQLVLDRLQVRASGVGLAFMFVLCVGTALALALMLLGRFLSWGTAEPVDEAWADETFDVMFMGYGCFISFLIAQVYMLHRHDPSIFAESDVGLWDITKYCLSISLLGFIPDALQHDPIEPSLTAQGIMRPVQFAVRLLMAVTIVSGTFGYLDRRHRIRHPF